MSSKAYRIPSAIDRLRKQQIQIREMQALQRNRNTPRPVASTAFAGVSPAGSQGGTGNFLATEGDTMIGPFALAPPVDFSVDIDADGILDIGESSSNSQYSSNIQIEDVPTSSTLDTIAGAAFDGQILVIRTFAPDPITIAQATLANGGNIQTPNDADFTIGDLQMISLVFDAALIVFDNAPGGTWRVLTGDTVGGGGGTGTGTFVSADLTTDQITNLAINDHVEFDRNTPPTGADGGIVLQTGVGQANGIFELKAGVTYFLSGGVAPLFGAANDIDLVWFDITNTNELGRRARFGDAVLAMNQPKAEIIFTPGIDVNVEFRLVAATTPANLNGYDADHTFASIFEFSGIAGTPGSEGVPTWKLPARSKSLEDIPDLATFTVLNDSVTLVEGDRVLLTEQVTLSENGLYQVGVVAAGSAPLTRTTDFDVSSDVLSETFVAIEEGAEFANELYHLISNNPLTLEVSDQVWEIFAPGSSGGPDLGGGADGIDSAGFFVNDGRIAVGAAILKNWEQVEDFVYPDNGPKHLLYLNGTFSPVAQGRLIMCGDSTQGRGASFSDNFGTTFTLSTGLGTNDNYIKMAYDPDGTVLVAVADNAPNAARAVNRSTDRGTSFGGTSFAGSPFLIKDVIWSVSDSQFVLCESTATTTDRIWTSPDGDTWTQQTTPAALLGGWFKLAYDSINGLYVCKGNSSNDVMTSPDAITWTLGATNLVVSLPKRIIHAPGQEKFVAVGLSNFVFISKDGITWTQNNIDGATIITDIIYAEDLSLFLAIGDPTTDPKIFFYSNDAMTWFQTPVNRFRIPGAVGTVLSTISVAYSEEYGIFFGTAGASSTTPFTANARLWRTDVEFNDTI